MNIESSKEVTLQQVIDSGCKLTPMMEQYAEVKRQFPDNLIFFRMGDFYEMFFEDAHLSSKLLNISLTHRGKIGDFAIPMSGIPHHAAGTYIERLTQLNQKVVICEQLEDPKSVKGLVKRGITQIVTPAMPYDLDKVNQKDNRFIASSFYENSFYYLVLVDFTTGDFLGYKFSDKEEFLSKIKIYRPTEFLLFLGQWENTPEFEKTLIETASLPTHLSQEYFEPKLQKSLLEKLIPHFQKDFFLSAESQFLKPLSALAYYIHSTQLLEQLNHIRPFKLIHTDSHLKVSFSTLRGLEIFPKDKESYHQSVLGFMDRTKTYMGSRALKELFHSPLRNEKQLNRRLDLIESFYVKPNIISAIRQILSVTWDIDRIMCKSSTKKISPSDLLNLSKTLEAFLKLTTLLGNDHLLIEGLKTKEFDILEKIFQEINDAINDEIGANLDKGNLIKNGFNKERDRLYQLAFDSGQKILDLENYYRSETGIGNLKVKSNNIAGFYIEVSLSHLKKVPASFQRRQTLVNNERFVTKELTQLENEILLAQEKLRKIEKNIFDTIISKIELSSALILDIAKRMAQIDVYSTLAQIALTEKFSRPSFKTSPGLTIKGAWHPLIKSQLGELFVHHNIELSSSTQTFALITGPNMAGKTTVMREMAIIQFLAQIGSYIPAYSANIGLCDFLFSRLGASDDIVRGQSTFMVEMTETAEILRHATDKSLIILDEIGRGTSTYDGLAIAWALVEHLVTKVKAVTLFSTHYHELIELVDKLESAINMTVRTEERKGKVHFLYELISGGATQSFGIHVAELAGIEKTLIKRAKQILGKLELSQENPTQLDIFNSQEKISTKFPPSTKVEAELKNMDINSLTPIEALQKLDQWQKELSTHVN